MRILAVDVGTGTQDILVFDSSASIENALQLIMPSPTQIAGGRIRRATAQRRAVALSGVIAGGGPCHWALEDHLRAGFAAYATPEAAATFDDDLDQVQRLGVTLVSPDQLLALDADHVELRDLDLDAIRTALSAFDVDTDFDGLALGCLDHGAAPPGYSDRLFRFDHLRRVVERRNDLLAFAYLPEELPDYLTRARTLVSCADEGVPTVFLDTGPAAALGALQDPNVACRDEQLVLNLGNMHALAFHLQGTRIISLYEHHTGELTAEQVEDFTERLLNGDLPHEDVFSSKGHGVYYATESASSPVGAQHATQPLHTSTHQDPSQPAHPAEGISTAPTRPDSRHSEPRGAMGGGGEGEESRRTVHAQHSARPFVAVTGPQRGKLRGSRLNPYFAVPHGDMMVSGCFGLLTAFAEKHSEAREVIHSALRTA